MRNLTEKEKMELGLIYDANSNESLIKEREYAKEICFQYNQLPPSRAEERKSIIKKLFGKTGESFFDRTIFLL